MAGTVPVKIARVFLDGWRPYAWIVGLIFLVYAQTLSFDFTYLDDSEFILDNYDFISDLSNAGKAFGQTIFSNPNIPYYRPVLALSLMLDAQLGGSAPLVYHLTNILLHAAVACLVFLLIASLAGRRDPALILALLFGVHPVLTQAVAWVPGRNDILLALFVLLAFLSFLRYCGSGKLAYYLGSMFFFGLALFTKESALILLGLFILFLWLERGRTAMREDEPLALCGWFAVAGSWFLIRRAALIAACDTSTLDGMSAAVMKSLPAFIQYIGKILLPFNLSVYPTIRDTGFAYGAASVLIILSVIALSRLRNWRLIGFGFCWFAFFLASSFIRPLPKCVLDFQEHRMYLPMIGFAVALTGIGWVKALDLKRPVILTVWIVTAAVLSALTIRHEVSFRDKWAFWDNAVETSPGSAYIHLRTGFVYYVNGALDRAEAEFNKALELDPELPAAHTKLGLLYMDKKRYNEAASEFREEIRIWPRSGMAYMCLGVARFKQGRPEEAEQLWKRALRVDPYGVEARKNLAVYYYERGDKARAAFYARELKGMGMPVPPEFLEGSH